MAFAQTFIPMPDLTTQLKTWTESHALAIGLSLAGVLLGLPIGLFVAVASLTFCVLMLRFRMSWTPMGPFGAANTITALRLLGVFGLFWIPAAKPAWVGSFAILLFAADALDGRVARKWALCSEFGEFFDKEVDAFFLLSLCLLLYSSGRFGIWILIPGILRYGFVAVLRFARPLENKEARSKLGLWSYFFMMLALITAFLLPNWISNPLTFLATLTLCVSFADSMRRMQWMPKTTRE